MGATLGDFIMAGLDDLEPAVGNAKLRTREDFTFWHVEAEILDECYVRLGNIRELLRARMLQADPSRQRLFDAEHRINSHNEEIYPKRLGRSDV